MRVFLFCYFISLAAFSQTIQFKGSIINKETKEPVVYANISFLTTDRGISSNEDGTFSLEIDKKILNEKVHISCLNYKDTVVLASQIQNKVLKLTSENYELEEVVISKKVDRKVILDKVKRRIIPMYSGNTVKMFAKFFPNNYPENYYIEKINIHFSRRGARKSKFRIRIFSVDSLTGKPNKDLLLKSIPILLEEDQKVINIDLENFIIEAPKNGFYIAFEKLFIEENKFIEKKGHFKNRVWYSPVIGLTKTKEIKSKDCKIYLFNKGRWVNVPKVDEKDTWVPAISVTLSN